MINFINSIVLLKGMIIVTYTEIALKGRNRHKFENKLVFNIIDCLKKNRVKYRKVKRIRGRILIDTDEKCPELANVFGIGSFSYALTCDADDIKGNIDFFIKKVKGSFKISSRIIEKNEKLSREKLNVALGSFVQNKTKAEVDLNNPDHELFVEVMGDKAYLFDEKIDGLGGLPIGTQGIVNVVVDSRRSLLAAVLMMKRGCKVQLYLRKKVDYSVLKKYEYGFKLKVIDELNEFIPSISEDNFNPLVGFSDKEIKELCKRYGL